MQIPIPLKGGDLLANQSARITAFVTHLYGDWLNGVPAHDWHYSKTNKWRAALLF